MFARTRIHTFVAVTMIAVFGSMAPAGAVDLWDYRLNGEAEIGWGFLVNDLSDRERGKFEEYSGTDSGLQNYLYLQMLSKDGLYLHEIEADRAGDDDQRFFLHSARSGLYSFEFEWNQIPHVLSTNARWFDRKVRPGVFVLPTPRPALSDYNNAPYVDDVSVQWDIARFGFTVTPTPDMDIMTEYRYTSKDGYRPKGVSFGDYTDPFREILQPVRYTDHDVHLTAGWNKKDYQLLMGYHFSLFKNDLASMIVENPAAADTSAAGGKAQVSLPPDNMENSLSLSGGWNLPYRSRVNVSFSYGWRVQDEPFLPFSIYDTTVIPSNATVPQSSLHGDVQTLNFFISGNSRPLDPLTLRASYRLYQYEDNSNDLFFRSFVLNDREVENDGRLALRYPFTKHDARFDAKWQFQWPVTLDLGYNWQRMDRQGDIYQQVPTMDEHIPKLSLDVKPLDWLLLSASYSHSLRRTSGKTSNLDLLPANHPPIKTSTNCFLCHSYTSAPGTTLSLLPPGHPSVNSTDCSSCHSSPPTVSATGVGRALTNQFNMSDLDRDRAEITLELTPADRLVLIANYSLVYENYLHSDYGILDNNGWSAGLNVSWRPLERLGFNFGYQHEELKVRQRVDPGSPGVPFDPGPYLTTRDTIDTFTFRGELGIIPQKLDLESRATLSFARSNFYNSNLPTMENNWTQYATYLKYRYKKNWLLKLGYIYEQYDCSDAYQRYVEPYPPGNGDDLYLGDYYRDYSAHIIALSLRYRF